MSKHKRKTLDEHFFFEDSVEFVIFVVWGLMVAALFGSLIN